MIDLDDPSSHDPIRVGGKAATLARARAAVAPVLPGFVVTGDASRAHMELGAQTLPARGSGGARLAVSGEPITFADALIMTGEKLGERLVARSSTLLEGSGEWSGAFASYLDLAPADLPKAVVGCWASAFSVSALQRHEAAGVEPGSFPMSVLVQPSLEPAAGGWARLAPDDTLEVRGIKGSPAPLLQGWEPGVEARYQGSWKGDDLMELLGLANLESIRHLLTGYAAQIGAGSCEWALTDRIWALQFINSVPRVPHGVVGDAADLAGLVDFVGALALAPGPLGEQVVLPWAIAGLRGVELADVAYGPVTIPEIRALSRELAGQVWGTAAKSAHRAFRDLLNQLGRGDIDRATEVLDRLHEPDADVATELLSRLNSLRDEMVARGIVSDPSSAWQLDLESIERALEGEPVPVRGRRGVGRWEPLMAAVVLATGTPHIGTPASQGIGAGLRVHQADPRTRPGSSRGVITSARPVPVLAPLLWDASGMVTASGSPAAHLFEAARSLRVPAVCGVDLGEPRKEVVAVDGHTGVVATLPLEQEI